MSDRIKWDFFCVTGDSDPELNGWGWRQWQGGALQRESAKRFDLFMECYRDARDHGFTGEINFSA